jgi:hypothetical protein
MPAATITAGIEWRASDPSGLAADWLMGLGAAHRRSSGNAGITTVKGGKLEMGQIVGGAREACATPASVPEKSRGLNPCG